VLLRPLLQVLQPSVLFSVSIASTLYSFDIIINMISLINDVLKSYIQEKEQTKYKKKRKMSKSYCKKTPCKDMGFSQKASCRPYKNCYSK
jgi:hypothetical protein